MLKKIQAILLIIFSCSVLNLTALPSFAEELDSAVPKYVDSLVTKVYSLLNDPKLSEDAKVSEASKLLVENLDLTWMAKYSLGRYKRTLAESQIQEFLPVYSHYVTKIYAEKVKDYKGEKSKVVKVYKLDTNQYIVKTEIMQGKGQPIRVDYMVRILPTGKNEALKVSDVITEGISMLNSQQSEFGSIISNTGFDALVKDLKAKSL